MERPIFNWPAENLKRRLSLKWIPALWIKPTLKNWIQSDKEIWEKISASFFYKRVPATYEMSIWIIQAYFSDFPAGTLKTQQYQNDKFRGVFDITSPQSKLKRLFRLKTCVSLQNYAIQGLRAIGHEWITNVTKAQNWTYGWYEPTMRPTNRCHSIWKYL